jgi:hypothetical protein
MNAELVNLRQFKKRKARDEKDKAAEANRVAFGRTKSEKSLTDTLNRKQRRAHDEKRLEPDEKSAVSPAQDPSGS